MLSTFAILPSFNKGVRLAKVLRFEVRIGEGPDSVPVGYGFKDRGDYMAVTFINPAGTRREVKTNCKMQGNDPEPAFYPAAAKIILNAYRTLFPSVEKKTWDEAVNEVINTSADSRADTIRAFKTAVAAVRHLLPTVEAPADLTPEQAQRFITLFKQTPYQIGKSPIKRIRTWVTVSYYLRSLSALWTRFRKLDIAKGNPWSEVELPKPEKVKKHVPTADEIQHFFQYVQTRYPKWERLDALLRLMLHSACRTNDIIQLKSAQLNNGELHFQAKQLKTKADRSVPLPADLYETLNRIGGKEWLWDGWNDDVKKFRPGRNPIPAAFSLKALKCVINNIFREYGDSHEGRERITPHSFRRYAITAMVKATGSIDHTATALSL